MRTLRSVGRSTGLFLLLCALLVVPVKSFGQFSLRITVAPPELVVYTQPVCPQEGYLWTPGYWAYGEEGYFWVPGTWVEPPTVGYLWTPGYWGWGDGVYAWNEGYWGSEVGFYGGVNYGFGYGGVGYEGGYWRNNQFSYNTYVNNIGTGGNFHNTYNKAVIVNTTARVSYNGGTGGITARPSPAQESAAHASHSAPTAAQSSQQHVASQNHESLASVNHGRPPVAATAKPGDFSGNNVVAARGATAGNKPAENKPVGNDAAPSKPAAINPTPDHAVQPERASATSQPTRSAVPAANRTSRPAQPLKSGVPAANNAGRSTQPGQPAVRSSAPRSEVNQPDRGNPGANPAHSAPAPRGESAPKPAVQQQQHQQQPQAQQQHQAAPRQDAAPRAPEGHPSAGKPDKPEGR